MSSRSSVALDAGAVASRAGSESSSGRGLRRGARRRAQSWLAYVCDDERVTSPSLGSIARGRVSRRCERRRRTALGRSRGVAPTWGRPKAFERRFGRRSEHPRTRGRPHARKQNASCVDRAVLLGVPGTEAYLAGERLRIAQRATAARSRHRRARAHGARIQCRVCRSSRAHTSSSRRSREARRGTEIQAGLGELDKADRWSTTRPSSYSRRFIHEERAELAQPPWR